MSTVEKHELLTVAEAARRLRVSAPTVYRRVADGTLAALQLGGPRHTIRVDLSALENPAAHVRDPESSGSRARTGRAGQVSE